MLDHAVAYATFPNLGKSVTPHAALEVRTGTGELVWRFDRDGPKPQQVIRPQVALDMIKMMNSVVENGTGKRAKLDGVQVAGKTGTTNVWRDAWFVGYTGNFVGAVWMGNDDYTLDQAHDRRHVAGDDLARHHGLRPSGHRVAAAARPAAADARAAAGRRCDAHRQRCAAPVLLTRKGTDVLVRVERLLDDANRALAAQCPPGPKARSTAPRPARARWRRRPIAAGAGPAATRRNLNRIMVTHDLVRSGIHFSGSCTSDQPDRPCACSSDHFSRSNSPPPSASARLG